MFEQTKIKVSTIETIDFNDIIEISNHCFGESFITTNKLNETFISEGVFLKIAYNQLTIGFCMVKNIPNTELEALYGTNSKLDHIFLFQTIAIHPKCQRKGFGTKLIQKVIQEIKSKFIKSALYYPSWDEPKSQAFCKTVLKNGFKEYKTYKNFWFDDSLANNYTCIICGEPPCTCSMKLFCWEIN
ncbi:MAG: GNAT family N-acetyltransferase [Salinivirgaceae bacterium]|jgi:GNAT superfamily N-acetyltransferase|nr:GNAT family N-acetyltransferase [Salinivirgaceae bacterium]